MDPILIYDYLLLARRRIFEKVRPLGAEAYAREFPIGLGTLGRTLTHIMISEWYYVQRIERREVPAYESWPIRDDDPPAFGVLEAAWDKQAEGTRGALAGVRDWAEPFEYRVTDDRGRRLVVTASAAGLFTQLLLHEAHHRAQVLNMLRHLGAACDDVDFNALMFERREGAG